MTDDGWTDDEDNEPVKKANRVPLSELKDVIESVAPSLSLTTTNGYLPWALRLRLGNVLIQEHIRHFAVRS
jgi:hypothetical protein